MILWKQYPVNTASLRLSSQLAQSLNRAVIIFTVINNFTATNAPVASMRTCVACWYQFYCIIIVPALNDKNDTELPTGQARIPKHKTPNTMHFLFRGENLAKEHHYHLIHET